MNPIETNEKAIGAMPPYPPAAVLVTNPALVIRPIASGLQIEAEIQPLVSISPTQYDNTYFLYILAYLPDHSSTPQLTGASFNDREGYPSASPSEWLRIVTIGYDNPPDLGESPTYTLWDIHCMYQLAGRETAMGVLVNFQADDPLTSRGTITIVQRT